MEQVAGRIWTSQLANVRNKGRRIIKEEESTEMSMTL
jgi:hypothetical protein